MDCITASMKVYQNALDVRRLSFGGKKDRLVSDDKLVSCAKLLLY